MQGSKTPAGRCLIAGLGGLAVAALACLSVVGPPILHLSESGPRVLGAVRAGYPDLCHEWRDKMVARPGLGSWYTSWDVACISGYTGAVDVLMTVNVVNCQWREPLALSTDWRKMLTTITAAGQRLRRCP